MSEQGRTQTMEASLTVSGANTATFYALRPMKITRWGFVTTTALTVANSVLTGAVKEADGTAADPTGAAAGGTLTLVFGTHGLVNKGAYIEAENFVNSEPLVVVPGERFDITSDGGSTAGAGRVFVEYEPLPFQDPTRPSADPGSTQRATHLDALSELSA